MMKVMTMSLDANEPASEASATGSSAAFAILAQEHHRGLLIYARALCRNEATAADLVQDAFLTAWNGLGRFDVTRDFAAWVRGIVRNKWREYLRRHAREVDVDDETLTRWEARLACWDEARRDDRGDVFDALDDCLRRLPDGLGEPVRRFYYQEESGEGIAASLGLDPATFRKRLQRARETLRDCLDHKLQPAT